MKKLHTIEKLLIEPLWLSEAWLFYLISNAATSAELMQFLPPRSIGCKWITFPSKIGKLIRFKAWLFSLLQPEVQSTNKSFLQSIAIVTPFSNLMASIPIDLILPWRIMFLTLLIPFIRVLHDLKKLKFSWTVNTI